MKTFVMGDIHGAYKALKQCLERSNFDYEKDTLIQLGDICDGWNEVYDCVEELSTIKNLILITGNHDTWFIEWLRTGNHSVRWLQGGDGTLISYCTKLGKEYFPKMSGYITNLLPIDLPLSHKKFFDEQKLYYVDFKNRMFVHGGFNRLDYVDYLEHINPMDFYWNREMWNEALSCSKGVKLKTANEFNEVFIGHTSTTFWKTDKPMNSGGVWNLDTGASWSGKLTIMDVNTKEYWQSDNVRELYNNLNGRN